MGEKEKRKKEVEGKTCREEMDRKRGRGREGRRREENNRKRGEKRQNGSK